MFCRWLPGLRCWRRPGGSPGTPTGKTERKKKIVEFLFEKIRLRSVQKTLNFKKPLLKARAQIFKLLRSPKIESKEQIPPGFVAWRAGTTTLFPLGSLAPIDCLKIPALEP